MHGRQKKITRAWEEEEGLQHR
ncbi:hypothetical protein A2U01_0116889, partial [Trifolium medium]|nr:hypothetical protein [Trifolium medium]